MMYNFKFFFNSILLGVGLAMDAFSVSMANGLNEPKMNKNKVILIASVFSILQALMPITGWFCVNFIIKYFIMFKKFIPWIAFILLLFIGSKMLIEGFQNKSSYTKKSKITFNILLIQGIATSIDALSAGFTIAQYTFIKAFIVSLIIAIVTFIICVLGLIIGKKFGTKLSNKAQIFGGFILIFIGLEIIVSGII